MTSSSLHELMLHYAYFYPLTMAWIWISGGLYFFLQKEHGKPRHDETPEIDGPWPKATFITPCHNEEENVRDTIAALAGQDYPQFEIIAVNDGSTDRTGEILDQLTAVHPMLRVLHLKQNQGKAVGLRTAVLAASSDYVVSVDGDAMLEPRAGRWLLHHLVRHPEVGAVTGNPRIRNRSTILGRLQVGEFSSVIGLVKRAQIIHGCIFTVSGVVAAFRRSALQEVHYWGNDMVTEDIDVSWRLQKNGWRIRYEPNALCWILMPETLRGLWAQRLRWAQGGMEVVLRHFASLMHWEKRIMWPLLAEFILSALWAYVVAALILLWVLDLVFSLSWGPSLPLFLPGWYGVVLAATCLAQFALSLVIESRYERRVGGGSCCGWCGIRSFIGPWACSPPWPGWSWPCRNRPACAPLGRALTGASAKNFQPCTNPHRESPMNPHPHSPAFPRHAVSPLIHHPSRQSAASRGLFLGLTAVAWMVWIYLWSPLLVLAFRALVPSSGGLPEAVPVATPAAVLLAGMVVGSFLLTSGWVACRKWVLSRKLTRRFPLWKSSGQIRNPDGLDAESAGHLSLASRVMVHFNTLGKPIRVLVHGHEGTGSPG